MKVKPFDTYPSTVYPADADLISSVVLWWSHDFSLPMKMTLACFARFFSERTSDERLGCFQNQR